MATPIETGRYAGRQVGVQLVPVDHFQIEDSLTFAIAFIADFDKNLTQALKTRGFKA
jgi:hypothetical protein